MSGRNRAAAWKVAGDGKVDAALTGLVVEGEIDGLVVQVIILSLNGLIDLVAEDEDGGILYDGDVLEVPHGLIPVQLAVDVVGDDDGGPETPYLSDPLASLGERGPRESGGKPRIFDNEGPDAALAATGVGYDGEGGIMRKNLVGAHVKEVEVSEAERSGAVGAEIDDHRRGREEGLRGLVGIGILVG